MSDQQLKLKVTRNHKKIRSELPPIPDKLYFTIGEVGKLCHLKPHVLRYWEQEFPQLSPNKRRGNRRYYQRKDVLQIRAIKHLLYHQGFTIEGARTKLFAEENKANNVTNSTASPEFIKKIISQLENLLSQLEYEI